MCLILFALHQHADYPLVVIANRDEYYERPTKSAHWWKEHSNIFAGRDLQAQGTWIGVNKGGKFAAVTNVREPNSMSPGKRSRGDLTRNFLAGNLNAQAYLSAIELNSEDYSGFNLLVGDLSGLWFFSNRQPGIRHIPAGIFGISNGQFDEAWPKLISARSALGKSLEGEIDDDKLMHILSDRLQAPDHLLPDTGVSQDIEQLLSSRFIESDDYGTRASSIIKFSKQNRIQFIEQNYLPQGQIGRFVSESILVEPEVS